jgi:hypothetical protein
MPKPTMDLVVVGPELAEFFLLDNTHNRRNDHHRVNHLAGIIERDEWQITNDAIVRQAPSIHDRGLLDNGQHRLSAIIKTGIPVPLWVMHGSSQLAQDAMDRNRPRRLGDQLGSHGYADGSNLASTLTKVHAVRVGGWKALMSAKGLAPTVPQALELLKNEPGLIEANRRGRTNDLKRLMFTPSLAGALFHLFSDIDAEDTVFFFDRLGDGQSLAEGDAIYALRCWFEVNRDATKRATVGYAGAVTVKAWNAYREGREVKRLYWKQGGANPEKYPEPV